MKKLGLRVTSYWHKSRKYNSYKGKVGTVAKNKLHRRFRTSIPHQKITTDTTEFKYYEDGIQKKCYLNPYIDLFNSEVISYHISKQPSYQSIDIALNQALAVTSDCPYRRTFHSDQGWGYQMRDYVSKLKSHRIFQSMSRKETVMIIQLWRISLGYLNKKFTTDISSRLSKNLNRLL